MRISDWSSDVCSSDLLATGIVHQRADFGNRSFKHTMSRWIGDHECGQTLAYFGDLGFQVFNVDVAVFVGSHHDHIHAGQLRRSEEHTSELQSLMRISYAVFCLKKKNQLNTH